MTSNVLAQRVYLRGIPANAAGDRIEGTIVSTRGAQVRSARWRAVRDPATKHPIEAGFRTSDHGW